MLKYLNLDIYLRISPKNSPCHLCAITDLPVKQYFTYVIILRVVCINIDIYNMLYSIIV